MAAIYSIDGTFIPQKGEAFRRARDLSRDVSHVVVVREHAIYPGLDRGRALLCAALNNEWEEGRTQIAAFRKGRLLKGWL